MSCPSAINGGWLPDHELHRNCEWHRGGDDAADDEDEDEDEDDDDDDDDTHGQRRRNRRSQCDTCESS